MLTEFPGGNPPAHPPVRGIFHPVVKTSIAKSPPSSPPSILLNPALAYLHGRMTLAREAAASFHKASLPLYHSFWVQTGPWTPGWPPAGSGASMLGSQLTARGSKAGMMPFIHTCASPLMQGATRVWRTEFAQLSDKGQAPFLAVPWDWSRTAGGSFPSGKALLLQQTRAELVESSDIYTAVFQNTNISPHSLFQNSNTQGF